MMLSLPLLGVPSSFSMKSSTAFWFFRSTFWKWNEEKNKMTQSMQKQKQKSNPGGSDRKNPEAHKGIYACTN